MGASREGLGLQGPHTGTLNMDKIANAVLRGLIRAAGKTKSGWQAFTPKVVPAARWLAGMKPGVAFDDAPVRNILNGLKLTGVPGSKLLRRAATASAVTSGGYIAVKGGIKAYDTLWEDFAREAGRRLGWSPENTAAFRGQLGTQGVKVIASALNPFNLHPLDKQIRQEGLSYIKHQLLAPTSDPDGPPSWWDSVRNVLAHGTPYAVATKGVAGFAKARLAATMEHATMQERADRLTSAAGLLTQAQLRSSPIWSHISPLLLQAGTNTVNPWLRKNQPPPVLSMPPLPWRGQNRWPHPRSVQTQ